VTARPDTSRAERGQRRAAFAAGEQRLEPAHRLDRLALARDPALVAFERRLHAFEIAERAPGLRRARVVAELLVDAGGAAVVAPLDEQPRGALERAPLHFSERGPGGARQQRLGGREPQRAQLVGERGARLGLWRLGEGGLHEPGRGVEVGEGDVGQPAFVADRREQIGEDLPALLADQPPGQPDQIPSAQDGELGVEHPPRATHRSILTALSGAAMR
jgi:hypothetical protein